MRTCLVALWRGFRFLGDLKMATYTNYVPVKLPDDQLRELDRLAREREISRSEVLRLGLRVLAEKRQADDEKET